MKKQKLNINLYYCQSVLCLIFKLVFFNGSVPVRGTINKGVRILFLLLFLF